MDKQTTNQVRQVLMNELGLTRESVREIMEEIVEETVQRHVNSAKFDERLSILVDRAISGIRGPRNSMGWYPSLAEIVREEARTLLAAWIAKHLRFVGEEDGDQGSPSRA
jgi:hypothetical protein